MSKLRRSDSTAAQPLVSVLIPAFNAAATLGEAVASVLEGSYSKLDVVIVDDGSADSTATVAEQFVRTDPRVRLHQRPNGGLAAALNSALELARGDWIARLDADDIWHPSKLARQIEVAEQEPDAAFIYTFVRYVDAQGLVRSDAPPQHFPPQALCRSIYESLVGGGSSAIIKRSAIMEAGGFEEPFRSWEDLLLQLRISARHPIAYVPQYLVGYRATPGSLSANPGNMLGSWRQARRLIRELFPQVPEYVHDWAHAKRCAGLAEAFAWRGEYGQTVALLAEALRYDAGWTTRFLVYRTRRMLRRRLSRRVNQMTAPHFFDCNPHERIRTREREDDGKGAALGEMERRRTELLAQLDATLFPLAASATGSSQRDAPRPLHA